MNVALYWRSLISSVVVLLAGACVPSARSAQAGPSLSGAWKAGIEFQSGALAAFKGLEFMYVFNAGGTMTESSNYDAAPPVPPAYGVWRELGPNRYEANYQYYVTRPSTPAESATAGGGWMPDGYGVLTETITLATDGASFTSAIKLDLFYQAGQPVAGGGVGTAHGRRM
ncbi:MAG: hypothetical protein ABI647_14420 [Gemmatimonadota bacterium]